MNRCTSSVAILAFATVCTLSAVATAADRTIYAAPDKSLVFLSGVGYTWLKADELVYDRGRSQWARTIRRFRPRTSNASGLIPLPASAPIWRRLKSASRLLAQGPGATVPPCGCCRSPRRCRPISCDMPSTSASAPSARTRSRRQ
ncbi:conserved exported hypothetical protein [Mesorhizobium escarrei]|uniref:Uncharacterized protein n=1 Tax=Mesorhizobium escarrei TaxID=666018 RepID=A0ABN8K1K0_9HYPH|nr:conserved exported hypothetical protein [Mesorhizobium escarrei]